MAVFLLFSLFGAIDAKPLHSMASTIQQREILRYTLLAKTYNEHNAYRFAEELTKDEYSGRNSGTKGCDKAAQWIASQFKSWNLKPYQNDSYFQPFSSPMSLNSTSNVIGYIPAHNKKSQQSIILGAHYDHLGKDRLGNIFRGANDNASGTGTMMELARTLSENYFIIDINIVFIAFSAEEKGLIGSYYYCRNPLFPLDEVVAMINLDMVGTGIGPWEIATNFNQKKILEKAINDTFTYYQVKFRLASWYLKPVSDHFPFYEKGIPVLFFFRSNPSNIGGYHTIKDTINTVDPKNLGECGKLALVIMLIVVGPPLVVIPKQTISHSATDFIPPRGGGLIFSDCSL